MKRYKAFTLIELLVVVAIIALLISILLPSLSKARELAKRTVCSASLGGNGKALALYANQYRGYYPMATKARFRHSKTTTGLDPTNDTESTSYILMFDYAGNIGAHRWQAIVQAQPGQTLLGTQKDIPTKDQSYALPTRSMFLLVKNGLAQQGQFVCPSTGHEPDPMWADKPGHTPHGDLGAGTAATNVVAAAQLWDFLLPEHCDYGYMFAHDQQGEAAVEGMDPQYPVMADSNPYIRDQLTGGGTVSTTTGVSDARIGDNSKNHLSEGQNVLFADSHASFADQPTVGVGTDNIYTYWYSKRSPNANEPKEMGWAPDFNFVGNGLSGSSGDAPTNYRLDLVSRTDACLLP